MPFDNAAVIPQTNPLAAVGLTPISVERATAWRQLVVNRFLNRCPANQAAFRAALVADGKARWNMVPGMPLQMFDGTVAGSPKILRQLTARIRTTFPMACCTLHLFDRDPMLYVSLDDKPYCIAIWDGGVVRAIAGGIQLPMHQRLLRRMVATV